MAPSDIVKILKLGPTNSYLLKIENGYMLIDTSLSEYSIDFFRSLEEINVKPFEIRCLLITHSHDDHAGFAAEIKERTHCTIITHKNAVESLKQGTIINVGQFLNRQAKVTMSLYNWVKRRSFEYPPVNLTEKDLIITEDNDEALRKIGLAGKIIYTPGHTEDCISVILDNGDAFVSDACMSNLGFLHYRPIEVSNLTQVFKSWQKIIDSGAKTIYPAHGKPFPVEKLIRFKEKYAPSP